MLYFANVKGHIPLLEKLENGKPLTLTGSRVFINRLE
jgi:hypothetical protein